MRVFAGEEQRDARDVLRLAARKRIQLLQRRAFARSRALLLLEALRFVARNLAFGAHRADSDGVRADAIRGVLRGKRLGE